jgi:hypothetical protein
VSSLTVNVQVNGANGTALGVDAWPTTTFLNNPQRGASTPNAAATASGTTDGSGNVTLAGLSAVSYWLRVVDARGQNNWFSIPPAYIGGSTVVTIPWATPASTSGPISNNGGDTPGHQVQGDKLYAPWTHVHSIPAAASAMQLIQTISGGHLTYDFASIPQTFSHLRLIGSIASQAASNFQLFRMWLNGNTSPATYIQMYQDWSAGGGFSSSGLPASAKSILGTIYATNYASSFMAFTLDMPCYSLMLGNQHWNWNLMGERIGFQGSATIGTGSAQNTVGSITEITFDEDGGIGLYGAISLYGM